MKDIEYALIKAVHSVKGELTMVETFEFLVSSNLL